MSAEAPTADASGAEAKGATVVLVDEDDNELGVLDKLAAHQPPGHLHRAFSVFVYDGPTSANPERFLLQRRARTKYHFGGLWTNTCCSHQAPGESTIDAAIRRTKEELGVALASPEIMGSFIYRAADDASGLVEHEHDTVVAAKITEQPVPDPTEVEDFRWVERDELDRWIQAEPDAFTPWFPLALRAYDAAAKATGPHR